MDEDEENAAVVYAALDAAATTIALAWKSYVNRRIFQHLALTVRQAETSLSHEVLKQLSPVPSKDQAAPMSGILRFIKHHQVLFVRPYVSERSSVFSLISVRQRMW